MYKNFIFIFFISFLFAKTPTADPYTLSITKGVPSSIVEKCVSAITGDLYIQQEDIKVMGKEPIILERKYISRGNRKNKPSIWWFLNHLMIIHYESLRYAKIPEKDGSILSYIVPERKLKNKEKVFRFFTRKKKKKLKRRNKKISQHNYSDYHFIMDESSYQYGISNLSDSEISGKINVKNNKVILKPKEREIWVYSPDGSYRKYNCVSKAAPGYTYSSSMPKTSLKYFLTLESLPNGNKIIYKYNKNHLPIKIITKNPSFTKTYAWINIKYFYKKRNIAFEITTSDHRKIEYHIKKYIDSKYYFIGKVTSLENPEETLEYNSNHLLKSRNYPNKRKMYIEYYEKGKNTVLNKDINVSHDSSINQNVKTISMPIGNDDKLKKAYKFIYHTGILKERSGFTEVYDPYNNKTIYKYSPYLRLTEIQRFDNKNILKTKEKLIWDKEGTNDATFLSGKCLCDSNDNTIFFKRYYYDRRGNVIKERTYGNISGLQKPFLSLNNKGFPDGNNEFFEIRKTFTDDNTNRILKKEDDSGLSIQYEYLKKSDLITSQIISKNKKICLRYFFEYDSDNILIKKIIDDGNSKNKNNLSGVTVRKITQIIPKKSPFTGMPEIILEKYLNLKIKKECLLSKKILTYSSHGLVIKEDIYDANNKYQYSIHKTYDNNSRLTRVTNPIGQEKIFKYDQNNNKIFIQNFGKKLSEHMKYDYFNRLIENKKTGNRISHKTTKKYDLNSNMKEKIDYLNNKTEFEYDFSGNLIKETHPKILYKNTSINPQKKFFYDNFGRKIKEIDPNGNIKYFKYNIYNQPIKKIYPDGTFEQFIYNLDGTLKIHIDQNNVETHFSYDFLKRETNKKIISSGKILKEESKFYNGFSLTKYIDPEGNIITYKFDNSGKKIFDEYNNKKEKQYFYDSLGRLKSTKTFNNKNSFYTKYKRDFLNRIKEETKEDLTGKILFKQAYTYDPSGNKSSIIKYVQGKKSIEKIFYDPFQRIIKKINPLGFEINIKYNEAHINSLGQNVLQKIQTDAIGLKEITTFDALKRIISKEYFSKENISLRKEDLSLDASGNLIKHVLTTNNNHVNEIKTLYSYNKMNKITSQIDAYDKEEEKTTFFTYTKKGLIHQITKPNGIILTNTYDDLGRKTYLSSSDGSIEYFYSYNKLNQLLETKDLINHTSTEIFRDDKGRIIKEKLANGLTIEKKYDNINRKKLIVLPDQSQIEYIYNPISLKKVIRKDYLGNDLYFHEYLKYDLSNNCLHEKLIGKIGEIHNSFDMLNRHIEINTDYFYQKIQKFDAVGNIKQVQFNKEKITYEYDDLYQITKEDGLFKNCYNYDSNYNRTQKNEISYKINALNQITDFDENYCKYDKNGNLIEKFSKEPIYYKYDALDRLIEITSNSKKHFFIYDTFGRRISKQAISPTKESFKNFLFDDKNEIGIYKNNKTACLRILKPSKTAEMKSSISIEIKDKIYAPINDLFGNISSLVSLNDSSIKESYAYSAFGEEIIYDDNQKKVSSSKNPWRYCSKYKEKTGLVSFGDRFYDPELGRWINCDPKGYKDSRNLYVFVFNNSIIYIDLYGLNVYEPDDELGKMSINSIYYALNDKESHIGDLNRKELDFMRIGVINGIVTGFNEARSMAARISDLFAKGYNVHYIYNSTHNPVVDIQECVIGRMGIKTSPSYLLAKEWTDFLKQDEKNTYLQISHSQGAIHTKNALKMMNKNYRNRINVITIAPAAIVTRELAPHSMNYLSKRDFVPYTDIKAWGNRYDNIVRLSPHKDAPLLDHKFASPTYSEPLKKKLSLFIKNRSIDYNRR